MTFPLLVSPYLRPFRKNDRLVIDDGLGTVYEPNTAELDVLRAMWPGHESRPALEAAVATHGADVIAETLERLVDRGLAFADRADCDRALDAALEAQRHPVPFIDQVELTNVCPMKCGFCPRGIPGKLQRPTGFMARALFERLLAQLHPHQARYRAFELHHLGESLLHPELPELVAAAAARGLPTELSVNPSHLTPELSRGLLDGGLQRLVISLDGIDAPTLAAIRGPAARWDRAEKNLEALLAYAAGMPRPPTIVIQMIDLFRNRHQHDAFLRRWGALGLPFVHAYIKDLDGDDPDTKRPSATPNVYLCGYPWRSVVVLWDGRVVPCCRDDDARLVLGDLNTQSLVEIWNGPVATALREAHRTDTIPPGHLCDGCPWRREVFAAAAPQRHPDRARAAPLQW